MKTKSLKQLIEELGDDDKYRPAIQFIAEQLATQTRLLEENSRDIKRLENRAAAMDRRFAPKRQH